MSNGWINIRCPFCNDCGTHLGVNLKWKKAYCLYCHSRPTFAEILAALGYSSMDDLLGRQRLKAFETVRPPTEGLYLRSKSSTAQAKSLADSSITVEHMRAYWEYRAGKAFPQEYVDFCTTGRLFGHVVIRSHKVLPDSYTARAVPGVAQNMIKYLCPLPEEGWLAPQETLFFSDLVPPDKSVPILLVEGVFDAITVWRLGQQARCVAIPLHGTRASDTQMFLLSLFHEHPIIVMLDADAQVQGNYLGSKLALFGFRTAVYMWPDPRADDPASSPDDLIAAIEGKNLREAGRDFLPLDRMGG